MSVEIRSGAGLRGLSKSLLRLGKYVLGWQASRKAGFAEKSAQPILNGIPD